MTLGEARALVRLYINEPKAAHWTDAQLDTLIKLSNIDVFHQLVAQSPDSFVAITQVEIPANSGFINLADLPYLYSSTFKNGFFTRILGVATANAKYTSATTFAGSPGTATSPIPPVTRITDLYAFGAGQDSVSLGVNNSRPLTWKAVNNSQLFLYPHPPQTTWLWVWFIPTLRQPILDGDSLLVVGGPATGTFWFVNNNVAMFDELVPLLAAVKAKASVGDQDDGLAGIYRSRVDTMKQVLASSLQNMTPQTIMGNNIGR
jgi:hypothetical protein